MNIKYLLSGSINYDLLICDDAGPGYAHNMGWECVYLNDPVTVTKNMTIIVDNRIQKNEIDKLTELILENHTSRFFLKIVDPYYDNETHYYYQFLANVSALLNTYLLSVYEPKELTNKLKIQFDNKFIHLPYPYIRAKEIDVNKKKNQIIISGAISQFIYPYRYHIWKKATRSVCRFIFFYFLRHPGYPDLGMEVSKRPVFIKDDYIKTLSNFKYMLLCPSRCGIEFLKYMEYAYAGCIPVGLAPDSYPVSIKKLFLTLRSNHLITDAINILFKKHSANTITEIRDFLHETHNPSLLNNILESYIIENSLHTS